jgi:hypothetical protein
MTDSSFEITQPLDDARKLVKLINNGDGTYSIAAAIASLVPQTYDEIVLSYTGSDLTGVVYKQATVTIATLTLSYTGSNLTGVVRT